MPANVDLPEPLSPTMPVEASGRGGEVDMVEHRALPVIGVGNIAHDDTCVRGIDAARPTLGLGRIKDGEHLLGNRHAVHGGMENDPSARMGRKNSADRNTTQNAA